MNAAAYAKKNRKGATKETDGLLYQNILKEVKTRREKVAMTWIDNKKAYNMVSQSWIIECFKMYKISCKVLNFITKDIKNWKMELAAGGQTLAEVKLQRGIFQGVSFLLLLFVVTMMPLNYILKKCTVGNKFTKKR